ncbi:unnamed protein product [Peronospora belbahrii]|uniref:Fe2OG dioxygenase domain-containing protein n=1 Tax=Peronospora belbahrii TaxID=622444 RepID=A0AAU9L9L5_9STRA|nr:unnamed protein product [Peronospora belbahrii]CAH0518109.1 unnamed protein product [Peronospora belbahrii]
MDFCQLLREERARAREAVGSTRRSVIHDSKAPGKKTREQEEFIASLWLTLSLKVWTKRSKLDIGTFAKGPIPGVYYIPNWITPDEEKAILERVYAIPDDSELWVKLKHRRLQMWGGEVTTPFIPKPLPQWLRQISKTLVEIGVFTEDKQPNHALINEYGVGDCILPHEDGPAYFPLVSIINTGADCRVTFKRHREADNRIQIKSALERDNGRHFDFQLERRSLLLFTGEAYTRYLHSIDNIEVGTRISLTVRHVDLY